MNHKETDSPPERAEGSPEQSPATTRSDAETETAEREDGLDEPQRGLEDSDHELDTGSADTRADPSEQSAPNEGESESDDPRTEPDTPNGDPSGDGSFAVPDEPDEVLAVIDNEVFVGDEWEILITIDGVELPFRDYRTLDEAGGDLSERITHVRLVRTTEADGPTEDETSASEPIDEGGSGLSPSSETPIDHQQDDDAGTLEDRLGVLERELTRLQQSSDLPGASRNPDRSKTREDLDTVDPHPADVATGGRSAPDPTLGDRNGTTGPEIDRRGDPAEPPARIDERVSEALTEIERQLGVVGEQADAISENDQTDDQETESKQNRDLSIELDRLANHFSVATNARILGDVLHTLDAMTDILDDQHTTDQHLEAAIEELRAELADHAEVLERLEMGSLATSDLLEAMGTRIDGTDADVDEALSQQLEAALDADAARMIEVDGEERPLPDAVRHLLDAFEDLRDEADSDLPDDVDEELTALRSDVETIKQTLDMVSAEDEKARETDDIRREVRELERENKAIKELIEGLHQRI